MRPRTAVFAGIGLLGCLYAQQTPPSGYVDPQTAAMFTHIAEHAARIEPLLQQVRVAEWVSKGAPDTYTAQLAAIREQLQAIQTDMTGLALRPDRMQDAMKGLFRVTSFHRSLESLMGGLRRYQNPPLADLIESVAAEDQRDLESVQTYVLELAAEKEQEFQVVDHEAQRCRATISRQPPPSTKK